MGEWEWISTSPSLQKPPSHLECLTYFKYLESQIVKIPSDRKTLRAKTGSFVLNEGACFRQYYDELIEALRYNQLGGIERQREDSILNSEQTKAPEDIELYFCGPPLMNQAVQKMGEDFGIPDENIRFDDFGG